MRVMLPIASVLLWTVVSGCGDVSPPSRPPLAPPGIAIPTAENPAPPPPPPSASAAAPTPAPGQAASPAPPPPPPPPPGATQPAPGTKQVVADVGAGKKGHYGQGILVTPLSVYFRAAEMTVFKMQIPEAMKLYKAMNDNRGPATHDEFMQKIIQENQIRLPQLVHGERYVYDPKTEQLMIEKPAR